MQPHDTTEQPQEEWREVIGHEDLYQVSNLGRLRSLDRLVGFTRWPNGRIIRGRILKLQADRMGYFLIRPCIDGHRITLPVHRAVMQAFVGPRPPKHDIHHINGIKADNRLENLCYMLDSEHMKTIQFNQAKGERHHNAKFTDADIRAIRRLYATGLHSQRQLARQFKTDQGTIGGITRRKAWAHVE